MDIFSSIGRRLRDERERLGFSQSDMADAVASAAVAGATRQSQSLYEKGKRMPDAAYLSVVAALGIDIAYVLTGQRGAPNASGSSQLPSQLTPREAALLDNYRHAPEEGRVAIDKTSAALAQSHALTTQPRTAKHKAQGG